MDDIVVFVSRDTVTWLVSWDELTVTGGDGECGAERDGATCRRDAGHAGPHQGTVRRPRPPGFVLR